MPILVDINSASVILFIPHFISTTIAGPVAHKRQRDPNEAHPDSVDADGRKDMDDHPTPPPSFLLNKSQMLA